MNIQHKRIIITGAASGIGRALLTQLCQYDVQIVAADLETIDVRDLPERKAQVYGFKCDLSDQREVDQLFDYALETMGGIEIFIANAGFAYYEEIGEANWNRIEKIFQVNVVSPLYAVARMRNINPEQPYSVVITASAMGKLGLPGYSLYSGTKSAIDRFAEAYRYETPDNCHLSIVYPISTRTNFFDHNTHHAPIPFPSQTPEYVASKIIAGIQENRKSIFTSLTFQVFWTCNRFLPFLGTLYKAVEAWRFRRWKSQKAKVQQVAEHS